MIQYTQDRLSITLPVRFSPVIFKLMDSQAWREEQYKAEFVRQAVVEALMKRGIQIPEKMTWQKELEQQAAARKAQEEIEKYNDVFPPLD